MMAMKSVNNSYTSRTVFGELKAPLHKLMTGEIYVTDLDLSALKETTSLSLTDDGAALPFMV